MKKDSSRGIVEIVILLVIALVIIFLVGLQPSDIWDKFAKPILEKSWDIIVAVAHAIADAIKSKI